MNWKPLLICHCVAAYISELVFTVLLARLGTPGGNPFLEGILLLLAPILVVIRYPLLPFTRERCSSTHWISFLVYLGVFGLAYVLTMRTKRKDAAVQPPSAGGNAR